MRNDMARRWYLTVLAAVYFALCSAGSLYYVSLVFRPDAGTVSVARLVLCLAFAIAAGAYFVAPRLGHISLTFLTVLTLIMIGTTNPEGTAFHLCVLLVLVLPFMRKRKHNPSASNRVEAGVAGGP